MRHTTVIATLATLVALASGLALAASGNETKGKYYFKKTCKTCHAKGGSGGEVTPLTKTQEQWKRYFAKGAHKKGSEKLSDVVPAQQLVDMETFLVNHAADSPAPETCG